MPPLPNRDRVARRWWGWGDPEREYPADEAARFVAGLELRFGPLPGTPAVRAGDVQLPQGRLEPAALRRLRDAVGADTVRTDDEERLRHAHGQSYPELIRLMAGDVRAAPDAVVFPASHDATLAALRAATEFGLGVVPVGGATSVTGGLDAPSRPYLALSTRRLARVLGVDLASGTVSVEAGVLGPELEAALKSHGLTFGHYPQSFEHSTLGGWIATRSAGQQSTGYGKIEDLVLGARIASPVGELALDPRPAAAEGPNLLQVIVGSEGHLGVITEATLRVRDVAAERQYVAWSLPSFDRGLEAVREIARRGPLPTAVRLSDEAETATFWMLESDRPRGVLLIVGVEGERADVAYRLSVVAGRLGSAGATSLGPDAGAAWYARRFDLPYLRDVLLERGLLVDVIETAALWSGVTRVYRAATAALGEALRGAHILCHVSHVYDVGASLYLTFLAPRDRDWEAQWWRAKTAALDAIVASGGVVSHQHGIGAHHRPWYQRRLGGPGTAIVTAIASALDPSGVLRRA